MKRLMKCLCLLTALLLAFGACGLFDRDTGGGPEETGTSAATTTAVTTTAEPSTSVYNYTVINFKASDLKLGMSFQDWMDVVHENANGQYIAKYGLAWEMSLRPGGFSVSTFQRGMFLCFNKDEKLELVRVFEPVFSTGKGINIGDTKEKVIKTYGEPFDFDEGDHSYDYKISGGHLIFDFDMDRKVYGWQMSDISLAEIIANRVT